jgi:hypothetical protein
MKSALRWLINFTLFLGGPPMAYAQTYAPTVTMTVTAPDGQRQELSARESGVATLKLKDGTIYELRPTVHDEPFTKVTVAIFKSATTTAATSSLGEVEVTKGGPAIASRTTPSFKIAVKSIELAAPKTTS